jgi:hypothetical protein
MKSSASATSVANRLRALAVLKLITSSNRVGLQVRHCLSARPPRYHAAYQKGFFRHMAATLARRTNVAFLRTCHQCETWSGA